MPKPIIDVDSCVGCGACADACEMGAIDVLDEFAEIVDESACVGCAACMDVCPMEAISEIED